MNGLSPARPSAWSSSCWCRCRRSCSTSCSRPALPRPCSSCSPPFRSCARRSSRSSPACCSCSPCSASRSTWPPAASFFSMATKGPERPDASSRPLDNSLWAATTLSDLFSSSPSSPSSTSSSATVPCAPLQSPPASPSTPPPPPALGTPPRSRRRSRQIAAGVMVALAAIPGLPKFSFLAIAGVGALLAARLPKPGKAKDGKVIEVADPGTLPAAEKDKPAAAKSDAIEDLLKLDELSLEVGYSLVNLVDVQQGGQLLARVKSLRSSLALQLGFIVPPIHITDNVL